MNDRKKTTKPEARKRAGAEAARSVSNKAVKGAEPEAKAAPKAPPSPPKSKARRKSVAPAAAVEAAPDVTLPAIPPAGPPGEAASAYWGESKRGSKPRSRPPVADLRMPSAPDAIDFAAGARPSQTEAVTVAPPAKRARRAEAALEGDDEIWTGDPAPAVSESEGSRLTRGSRGDPLRAAAEFGSAQSLLSTDYYFRQYGAHGMRRLSAEVDDFGFDPHVDEKLRPVLDLIAQKYFRVELVGAEQLPAEGRALLVANRGGTLPWDGLVLRSALRNARPQLSPLRWLAEDSVIHYPFMGVLMNRLGAVRACPENAERLLAQDRLVAVFPEGAQGSRKLFRDRYRLQRFGRGGYVKLALKFG
ncbi:MAG TPA: 1-acyl-sn-glycerol-3-phosphate acyltransferase, partial [Polyangiales bacterium]